TQMRLSPRYVTVLRPETTLSHMQRPVSALPQVHAGVSARPSDFLHRVSRARPQGQTHLVPRAGRYRSLHQQDRALPRELKGSKHNVTATDRAKELVKVAAEAAADRLAEEIIAYDVSEQLAITEAFVLCSAPNDRQVRSIVDEIEDQLRVKAGAKPIRREGE